MVDWDSFNRFEELNKKYLPFMGEGETMATQIATAVNKLVYKWYNDGDVYDNVQSPMDGWANDLSSYANWLWKYTDCSGLLEWIFEINNEDDYTELLYDLADRLLNKDVLEMMNTQPKVGSVYKCDGPFKFEEVNDYDF